MTEVLGISNPELEAIRSVERYIATSIPRGETFSPAQPVQEDLATVNRMLSRLAPAPPAEEVASKLNGETSQPAQRDDSAVDKLRWEILYSLLNFASCPEALKQFVDDALKIEDVDLLLAAQDALKRYLAKQDDIPIPF